MALKKLKVVLDADDVLLNCNGYALQLLSQEENVRYTLQDITGWGNLGKDVDRRFKFFEDPQFYITQPALPGAQDFLYRLMEVAEVMIMTAVYPQFMGERIKRLMELFPSFPMDHIIMGTRKDLVHADVMLDDGLHNLMNSNCDLPVIFRRPWNRDTTGICGVWNYEEFLTIVNFLTGNKNELSLVPKIVCIVGPSGSGKQRLADALCRQPGFVRIHTCTTAKSAKSHCEVVEPAFFELQKSSGAFLETTFYGGEQYGIRKKDISAVMHKGYNAVAVMDISGCMSVYNMYPGRCKILFVEADKRDCIYSILSKVGLRKDQVADRILSIDMEQKNKVLADAVISINGLTDFDAEAVAIADYIKD